MEILKRNMNQISTLVPGIKGLGRSINVSADDMPTQPVIQGLRDRFSSVKYKFTPWLTLKQRVILIPLGLFYLNSEIMTRVSGHEIGTEVLMQTQTLVLAKLQLDQLVDDMYISPVPFIIVTCN